MEQRQEIFKKSLYMGHISVIIVIKKDRTAYGPITKCILLYTYLDYGK